MQMQNDLLNIRGPNLIKFRLPKSFQLISKIKQQQKQGFGVQPIPPKMYHQAQRKRLREAIRLIEVLNKKSVFAITVTFPGSAPKALEALENYSSFIENAFDAYLEAFIPDAKFVRVWEYQSSRNALHIHCAVLIPPAYRRQFTREKFQALIARVLDAISSHSGVDMFEQLSGGTLRNDIESIQVDIEPVRKTLIYFSKVETKEPRILPDGKLVGPKHWGRVSRSLNTLYRDSTKLYVLAFKSTQERDEFSGKLSVTMGGVPSLIKAPHTGKVCYVVIEPENANIANYELKVLCRSNPEIVVNGDSILENVASVLNVAKPTSYETLMATLENSYLWEPGVIRDLLLNETRIYLETVRTVIETGQSIPFPPLFAGFRTVESKRARRKQQKGNTRISKIRCDHILSCRLQYIHEYGVEPSIRKLAVFSKSDSRTVKKALAYL